MTPMSDPYGCTNTIVIVQAFAARITRERGASSLLLNIRKIQLFPSCNTQGNGAMIVTSGMDDISPLSD